MTAAQKLHARLITKNSHLFGEEMPFSNYLLDIGFPDLELEKTLSKRFAVNIKGADIVLSKLFDEIKEKVNKKPLQFVSSRLGNDYSSVHCWLTGYNTIPILKAYSFLKIWKKTCGKTQKEVNTKWNDIFKNITEFSAPGGTKSIKLPKKLSVDLAYVIGFFLADGYIKDGKKLLSRKKFPEYSIVFYDNSEKFLKKIKKIFAAEFSAKCNLYYSKDNKGSWYSLRCTSKPIHRFFTKVLKLQAGYKQGFVKVSDIIKQSSPKLQKEFIAGFCDGEGCVGISTKNPYFEVVQTSRSEDPPEILVWIQKKLLEFGVSLSSPNRMSCGAWRIRTGSQKVINDYYSIISSRHDDKIPKFKAVKKFSYTKSK